MADIPEDEFRELWAEFQEDIGRVRKLSQHFNEDEQTIRREANRHGIAGDPDSGLQEILSQEKSELKRYKDDQDDEKLWAKLMKMDENRVPGNDI